MNSCLIRDMVADDLDEVLRIERSCHSHPWLAEAFRAELQNPLSHIDLLFFGDKLAGFLCSMLVCGELSILDVATDPDFRRKGVASTLLNHVLTRGCQSGMEEAFLEVRSGNIEAIALYRKFGFHEIDRRRGYYADGEEALVMAMDAAVWGSAFQGGEPSGQ